MGGVGFAKIMAERQETGRTPPDMNDQRSKVETRNLSFWYGQTQALFDVTTVIPERCVTALIGPSGCGKSTFLRTLNRMNEMIDGAKHIGQVFLAGHEVYGRDIDIVNLRKRVGMVFQKSIRSPRASSRTSPSVRASRVFATTAVWLISWSAV